MAAIVSLAEALADRRLFRGGQPLARDQGSTSTGFAALDEALPWNGFPRGALTEILLPAPGLGELELLSHAWARIGEKERLAFIAPPCIPYAPALLRAKWPLARFAWIEAPAAQAAWAAEQCLRAGCLGAVAFWLNGGDDKSLRRLQLAAEEGSVHAFLFRPLRHAANASPAALRLVLGSEPGTLKIHVLKVRGAVAPAKALQRERLAAATVAGDARPTHAAAAARDGDASTGTSGVRDGGIASIAGRVSHAGAVSGMCGMRDTRIASDADAMRDVGAAFATGALRNVNTAFTTGTLCNADVASDANGARDAGAARDAGVMHDAGSARTARAYRMLRTILAGRNLRAIVARRSSGV